MNVAYSISSRWNALPLLIDMFTITIETWTAHSHVSVKIRQTPTPWIWTTLAPQPFSLCEPEPGALCFVVPMTAWIATLTLHLLVHTPFASDDRSVCAPSHCVRQVNRVSLVLLFFRIASILEDPKDLWVADETTLCGNILSGLGGLVLSLIYFAFALEYSVFWGLFWIPELCIIYKTLGWDSGNNPNQINSTPSGHLYCWRSITGALIIN